MKFGTTVRIQFMSTILAGARRTTGLENGQDVELGWRARPRGEEGCTACNGVWGVGLWSMGACDVVRLLQICLYVRKSTSIL